MSKKTGKPAPTTAEERDYYRYEWEKLAVDRCDAANKLGNDAINSIQTAYFEKGLSVDDLVDVFQIPKIIINLLVTPPDEYETEMDDYDGYLFKIAQSNNGQATESTIRRSSGII